MFYGRHDGTIVIRDPHQKENLYWQAIESESPFVYQEGIEWLRERGFTVTALVIDGRRGVKEAFPGIPIQMCQFHQWQIVRRYLTNNPKLPAAQELRLIAMQLSDCSEAAFRKLLDDWISRWEWFLKEQTVNPNTGRKQYTHRRLRAAYFSLRRNLPYLFTYERYPKLGIPKTTNCLEGVFSHTKTAVRIHRGLRKHRKRKLINYLLQNHRP